jgi:hypothetical protein
MSERIIVLGSGGKLCADAGNTEEDCALLTSLQSGQEAQVGLSPHQARTLGEWLIERANQAGER